MNYINEIVKKGGYIDSPVYEGVNPKDLVLYKIDPTTYYLMSSEDAKEYHGVSDKNLFLSKNRIRNSLFPSKILYPHFNNNKIETPFSEGQRIFKIPGKEGTFFTTDLTHIPK